MLESSINVTDHLQQSGKEAETDASLFRLQATR